MMCGCANVRMLEFRPEEKMNFKMIGSRMSTLLNFGI